MQGGCVAASAAVPFGLSAALVRNPLGQAAKPPKGDPPALAAHLAPIVFQVTCI